VAYVPQADAIETVNVVTNSFDAEQGMAGGAAVNVQIKSGTNQFHGTGNWFRTDQNFMARNYFNNANLPQFKTKNKNIQNQFGGTLGGPIVKDKLFFFVAYEGTTQRQLAGPDTRTLPVTQMLSGDFRNLPGNPIIYDPATGNSHGAGKQEISCNGVLGVICPNRIDPAAMEMISLLGPSLEQTFPTGNESEQLRWKRNREFYPQQTPISRSITSRTRNPPSLGATASRRASYSTRLCWEMPAATQPMADNWVPRPASFKALVWVAPTRSSPICCLTGISALRGKTSVRPMALPQLRASTS
jgi:hypothetical protein